MKESYLTLLLTFFCLVTMAQEQNPQSSNKLGDANGDGKVNSADLVEVLRKIANKESAQFIMKNADINHDEVINVADIVGISNFITSSDRAEFRSLILWSKDGTKVAYALAEKPKITFTGTDLVITSKGVEVNYSLENMARFTYEDNTAMAITNLQTGMTSFKLDVESMLFPSLNANSTVSLYSLNGTLVFNKTIQKAGEYFFPLSGLNAGVYVVTVNGLTYKFLKR